MVRRSAGPWNMAPGGKLCVSRIPYQSVFVQQPVHITPFQTRRILNENSLWQTNQHKSSNRSKCSKEVKPIMIEHAGYLAKVLLDIKMCLHVFACVCVYV
jgi:hypothetical protein